jgi:hypothetical protein
MVPGRLSGRDDQLNTLRFLLSASRRAPKFLRRKSLVHRARRQLVGQLGHRPLDVLTHCVIHFGLILFENLSQFARSAADNGSSSSLKGNIAPALCTRPPS